jgi:hypothetical protein
MLAPNAGRRAILAILGRTGQSMTTRFADLRFARRDLARTPAVSLATTAILSAVNAALRRPLSYPRVGDPCAIRIACATASPAGRATRIDSERPRRQD